MAPFHHSQGLVVVCWLFAWCPSEGPPLSLATSKLGDLEREELTYFSVERDIGARPRPKDQGRGKDLGFGGCKIFDRLDCGRIVSLVVINMCCLVFVWPL